MRLSCAVLICLSVFDYCGGVIVVIAVAAATAADVATWWGRVAMHDVKQTTAAHVTIACCSIVMHCRYHLLNNTLQQCG